MKYVLSGNKLLSILVSSDDVVYEIRDSGVCAGECLNAASYALGPR